LNTELQNYFVFVSREKGGTKRDVAVFASKIQLLSKEVSYKVFCVKTSSGKVVATSFLYLTVLWATRFLLLVFLILSFLCRALD